MAPGPADFNNRTRLIRTGGNMYAVSPNPGAAVPGFPGEGSNSTVTSGALEMSTVDLAAELTSVITAERGFQSNARVITASDEMLQELLKPAAARRGRAAAGSAGTTAGSGAMARHRS